MAAAAGIISGATSVATNYSNTWYNYQANMQAAAGMDYQASQARNASLLAIQQAQAARVQGDALQRQLAVRGAEVIDTGVGGYAAGNVQVGTGSARAFEIDAASLLAVDVETQRYNTALDVWGYENTALQARYEAGMISRIAKQSRKLARLQLFTGLLTASGQGYSAYANAGGPTGPRGGGSAPASSSGGNSGGGNLTNIMNK